MPMRSPSVPVVGYLILRASNSAIVNDRTALDDHLRGITISAEKKIYQMLPEVPYRMVSSPDLIVPSSYLRMPEEKNLGSISYYYEAI
jgi:hypothetical protein